MQDENCCKVKMWVGCYSSQLRTENEWTKNTWRRTQMVTRRGKVRNWVINDINIRTSASQIATQEQRSVNADKTENQSQEANHRAEDIKAIGLKDEIQPKLPRIKFPPACDSETWSILVCAISKTRDKKLGKKKRLNKSGLVIYKVCKEIFGAKERINKPPAKENRRQRMVKDLRNKKKNLKRQLCLANFDEKEGLLKIWQDLKEKQCSQQGGKPEKETSEMKERARAFLPRTIQICKEHIW